MNELTLYSYDAAPMAVERKPRTGDYTISVFGGPPSTLRRGVDFGMIRRKDGSAQTKHPTLFKSGAEKVAVAYGLCRGTTWRARLRITAKASSFTASDAI